jgi:prevent-host-death family protein
MTYHVTADYASQNFEEIIQRANIEAEGVTIVKDNKSFVLIDREELEALIETADLPPSNTTILSASLTVLRR